MEDARKLAGEVTEKPSRRAFVEDSIEEAIEPDMQIQRKIGTSVSVALLRILLPANSSRLDLRAVLLSRELV